MHPIDSVIRDLKFVELIPSAGDEEVDELIDRLAVFYIPVDSRERVRYFLTRTQQEFDATHNRKDNRKDGYKRMVDMGIRAVGAISVTIRALEDKDDVTFGTFGGYNSRLDVTNKLIKNVLAKAYEERSAAARNHNAEIDRMFERMRRGEEIIPGIPFTDVLVLK